MIDTPEETAETVTQSHWDILGERDFNGDTFTILDAPHHTHLQVNFSVAEELTGEPINDALYLRDRFIEDKYNVNINFIQIPGFGEGNRVLERAVIAGDNTYDLIVSQTLLGHDAPRTTLLRLPLSRFAPISALPHDSVSHTFSSFRCILIHFPAYLPLLAVLILPCIPFSLFLT